MKIYKYLTFSVHIKTSDFRFDSDALVCLTPSILNMLHGPGVNETLKKRNTDRKETETCLSCWLTLLHIYNGMLWGHVCFVTNGRTFFSAPFSLGSSLGKHNQLLTCGEKGFKKFKSLLLVWSEREWSDWTSKFKDTENIWQNKASQNSPILFKMLIWIYPNKTFLQ